MKYFELNKLTRVSRIIVNSSTQLNSFLTRGQRAKTVIKFCSCKIVDSCDVNNSLIEASRTLTDGCQHGQRVQKRFGEVPLVFRDPSFRDWIRAADVRPAVLGRDHVLGDPFHQLILETRDFLGGQPRPILSIKYIQTLRDYPYILHRLRPCFVPDLETPPRYDHSSARNEITKERKISKRKTLSLSLGTSIKGKKPVFRETLFETIRRSSSKTINREVLLYFLWI